MSQNQGFADVAQHAAQQRIEQDLPQLMPPQPPHSPPDSPKALRRPSEAPSSPPLKPSPSPPYHPKPSPAFMHSIPVPAPVNIRKGMWTRGEVIGDGAFGTVYKALDNSSGSLFAVKQVPLQAFDKRNGNAALQNLVTEIELLQELVHTNIVRYFGCEISSDTMSIFLEYAPGGSITGMLRRFGALPEETIRVYTLHILLGLNFLHSTNIVHRDIKGSNVLVDTDGCCKLADFGCSKSLSDIADASPSFKGTMRFMAPEVVNGIDHGKPADVWALGCTIIEMLTARPPWAQFELPESAMFHVGSLKATPPIPSHASSELQDFLHCCFSSEPSERWTVPQLLGHPFITSVIDPKRDFVPFFLDNDGSSIGSSASYASSTRNPKASLTLGMGRSNSQTSFSATHHTETSVSSQQTFRPAFLEEAPMIIGREEELRLLLQGLASQPGDVKVAFIWGAGGTGKSALANRLCSLLHRAPVFFEKYQRQVKDLAKQMMSSWGWEELVDDRGVKYYGNPELKITQYQHPSLGIVGGLPQASLSSKYNTSVPLLRSELPKHSALALPFGWECLKDANGYTYFGNPQLKITQYQHPSLGIISQNKNPHQPINSFSGQSLGHSSTSSSSTSATARRQSRDSPGLDDLNELIPTQAINRTSNGVWSFIAVTFEQDDLTDASDDDVSDDEMEEFFTEENLGYAMKILEERQSFAHNSSKEGNPFVQIDMQASSSHPVSVNDAMDFVIRGAYTVMQQSMLPIEKELHLKRMYYASYGSKHKFVVFDDVGNAAHIRQLLPRSRSTIIITSRRNIGLEFEGVRCVSLNLQPLQQSKSIHLLQAIVPRLDVKSAAELAFLCGHLPLALKAIGSTLARRQHMDASEMCDILRKNPARRLALVENCVRQSFLCLDEQHRIFLVALHVFPGSFTSRAASAVIKSRLSLTEDALHELTEHSMLHYDKGARRYRLQDLVRVFCEQEAMSLPSVQKEKWIRRLLNFFLKSVTEAEEQYTTLGHAGFSYQNNPLRVLNVEKPNLEEVIRLAYQRKHNDLLVEMSRKARQVLRVVLSPSVRVLLYQICVVQMRQKNDKEGELVSLCELGHALGVMLLFAEAKICLRTSFGICKSLNSVPLQCWVSSTLAWVLFSEARHSLTVNEGSLDSLGASIHHRLCNEAEKLYSNVLEALEDYFLFYSDDSPERLSLPLPPLVQQSPKSAPLSPAVMPVEYHDPSIGASSADILAAAVGANSDESSFGVKTRRPSSLSLPDLSDAAVNEPPTSPPTSPNEKEKKGMWQGLLSSSKVPSFPSSFTRRPSLQDDSFLRVQRQTEKVMMRRLQASVTYKLALLESHMHRHEDAQYHYESALRMYNNNPRHPRVAAIMLGLGCLYMNTGNHIKSIEALQRALDIREEALGAGHPAVADILVNLIASMRLAAEKMPLAQGWEQKEDAERKSYWYNPGKQTVQYDRPLPDAFCDGSGGPTLKDLETRLCSLESQSSTNSNFSSSSDVLLGLQELFVQSAQPEGAFGRFLSLLGHRNKGSGSGAVAEATVPNHRISSSRSRSGSTASEWMSNIASTLTSSLGSIGRAGPLSQQKQDSSDSEGEIEGLHSEEHLEMKISKVPQGSRQDACVLM